MHVLKYTHEHMHAYTHTYTHTHTHTSPHIPRSKRAGWMPAHTATFTASKAATERPDTIDTTPGPAPGTRILANGGTLAGSAKLNRPFALKPGARGPPKLPSGVMPSTVFTTAAPVSPAKAACITAVQKPKPRATLCPLCDRKSDKCAPFCGGEVCGSSQCQGQNAPFPGERCIWKCVKGETMCYFHASGGKRCALCNDLGVVEWVFRKDTDHRLNVCIHTM